MMIDVEDTWWEVVENLKSKKDDLGSDGSMEDVDSNDWDSCSEGESMKLILGNKLDRTEKYNNSEPY